MPELFRDERYQKHRDYQHGAVAQVGELLAGHLKVRVSNSGVVPRVRRDYGLIIQSLVLGVDNASRGTLRLVEPQRLGSVQMHRDSKKVLVGITLQVDFSQGLLLGGRNELEPVHELLEELEVMLGFLELAELVEVPAAHPHEHALGVDILVLSELRNVDYQRFCHLQRGVSGCPLSAPCAPYSI
ncbi:uncharacterized protein YALI1_B11415g [Yarrowia lipolytica]|uniref:Uncharacterized protein n=1 Tax=Yarrowia lipolytica TaxID=4952 RepID=A0A1D8N702_YARLL|nr:hypothetical protein YALI1_B11415g [Yarrowia lipolytica]